MALTLVVEDGSVVTDANSFVSLASATTFMEENGRLTTWNTYTTEQQNAAIIQSTRYLCHRYTTRWKGMKYDEDQWLCWPRDQVEDQDGYAVSATLVPASVRWATAELAWRGVQDQGNLMPDQSGGPVKSVSVSDISESYFEGAQAGTSYNWVDTLLVDLITSSSVVKLSRG